MLSGSSPDRLHQPPPEAAAVSVKDQLLCGIQELPCTTCDLRLKLSRSPPCVPAQQHALWLYPLLCLHSEQVSHAVGWRLLRRELLCPVPDALHHLHHVLSLAIPWLAVTQACSMGGQLHGPASSLLQALAAERLVHHVALRAPVAGMLHQQHHGLAEDATPDVLRRHQEHPRSQPGDVWPAGDQHGLRKDGQRRHEEREATQGDGVPA
mmetsp:Transcript_52/g.124  ORF Transcript_52/g.124 Transcript_52/m.124 type:complete len:209 (+) Transcript_52:106-732(+)